jgi:hypothetical protein
MYVTNSALLPVYQLDLYCRLFVRIKYSYLGMPSYDVKGFRKSFL